MSCSKLKIEHNDCSLACKGNSHVRTIFAKWSGTWLSRGSYGVYVLLYFAKIAVRGFIFIQFYLKQGSLFRAKRPALKKSPVYIQYS